MGFFLQQSSLGLQQLTRDAYVSTIAFKCPSNFPQLVIDPLPLALALPRQVPRLKTRSRARLTSPDWAQKLVSSAKTTLWFR